MSSRFQVSVTEPLQGYLQYREEIDAAISRVLQSGQYILGCEVQAFEESFSTYCGVRHAVGVASGTDALSLALRSVGVCVGDAVFTVSHTAVATIAAIELAGATPVLVDVDPDTYTIDTQKLADTVSEFTQSNPDIRPKAVVAVHLYGHPCDMQELRRLCDEHGLLLIEDCAQAHGATYAGKRVGSFGDAAAFSFYPTKNLAAFGDGGAIVTDDMEVARKCRALREYGWYTRYKSEIAGQNSRLDELQAAILSVRLRHLDDELGKRRAIAQEYDDQLADILAVPVVREGCLHAYHLYVVKSQLRDELKNSLSRRGIGSAVHYPFPSHQQSAYKGRLRIGSSGLNVTERLTREILTLPMHPFLSTDNVAAVVSAIRSWSRKVQQP